MSGDQTMKRYKITIVETGQEERIRGKEWAPKASGEEGYAYTPQIMKVSDYEREIYTQIVDDIDLPRVISAVNGME